jgi:hypothetical protein
MTAVALILTAAAFAAIGYWVRYRLGAEDRADADWAWRVIDIARAGRDRTLTRLAQAKVRPVHLPEPTRGRFVARRPDDPRRLLIEAAQTMRETARRRVQ